MRLNRKFLAVLVAGVAMSASDAQAQNFSNACGGAEYFSCVNLSTTGIGTSTLTFTVTNVSNGGDANNPNSVFKLFGVGSTGSKPSSIGTTSSNFTTDCSTAISGCDSGHRQTNYFNGAGFTGTNYSGLDAKAPAPKNGLQNGESASFFLTFTSITKANSFLNNGFQFALHDIGGLTAACGSSKAVFGADGTPTDDSDSPANQLTCNGQPGVPSTVPEPSSMALLGTGLVGLVPMIRRRRK